MKDREGYFRGTNQRDDQERLGELIEKIERVVADGPYTHNESICWYCDRGIQAEEVNQRKRGHAPNCYYLRAWEMVYA